MHFSVALLILAVLELALLHLGLAIPSGGVNDSQTDILPSRHPNHRRWHHADGLPACLGATDSVNAHQNQPVNWPVKGTPVSLFTPEPVSIWEFRIIPMETFHKTQEGWQAIAPLVNQTGAGHSCMTKIIGVGELLGVDVVLQVHMHINLTHSYHQCALIRFTDGGPDPVPETCKTDSTVSASWTKALPKGSGFGAAGSSPETGDGYPTIPHDLEKATCPSYRDPAAALPKEAVSSIVLGRDTKNPCVMFLRPMREKEIEDETHPHSDRQDEIESSAAAAKVGYMLSA